MKRKLIPFSCSLVTALLLLCADASAELWPRPSDRISKEVRVLLHKRDFEALDRMADQLKAPRRMLSDGQPALIGFYDGVSMCVSALCGDRLRSSQEWEEQGRLLEEWTSTRPGSVTAKIARAVFMKEYGWYARGTSFADRVPPAAMKEFKDRIQRARGMFEAIGAEGHTDPAWYAGMLSVGLAQSWPASQFDQLFNDGTRKFPYYLPLYFTKASYLSPRWGGSAESFTAYVDDVVRATSATMGESMYARIHWSSWSPDMFSSGKTDWNRMKDGFVRLTQDYPDPWNLSNFARFACMAGDLPTLRGLLPKVSNPPIFEAWRSPDFFMDCVEKARR